MAEAKQSPTASSLILHSPMRYDLLLWLLTFGREARLRESLLRLAHLISGESVLDVGCGTGTLAIGATKQVGSGGRVEGIDASAQMLERACRKARRAGANVSLKNALAESLPFPDAEFDAVLSTVMLHHLSDKIRRQSASEFRRVLKPGGRVLAVDFGATPTQKKGIVAHFHRHGHINLDEMVSLMTTVGLCITEKGDVGIGGLQFVLAPASPRT